MNVPCSGEICIIAIGSAAVSSMSACCTASGGVPCATTYSWISGVRKNDLGPAIRPVIPLRRPGLRPRLRCILIRPPYDTPARSVVVVKRLARRSKSDASG